MNRTPKLVTLVLAFALAAGLMVAGYLHAVIGTPKQAEFLREKP